MKHLPILILIIAGSFFISCNTSAKSVKSVRTEQNLINQDTVRIANEELEYEIIIIEPGFYNWLIGNARPEGYYSQSFLENRNKLLVMEWNMRVNQPLQFNPDLYQWRIDYDPMIDYGYEVNYKLYYYFVFFQMRYNQQLSVFYPRI